MIIEPFIKADIVISQLFEACYLAAIFVLSSL